jgi:NAD-dependent deacetylase
VLVLTGAGISAESGIPTFRGPEGYWTVGQHNYRPEELATASAFKRLPEDIWGWYLFRRGVCARAEPNPAHFALAQLEQRLQDRVTLVTQNVDGLHLRAGNTLPRTWQIHGNIQYMRCHEGCGADPLPVPDQLPLDWPRNRAIGSAQWHHLRCPHCGARTRPHVLWFDECYDEEHYRLQSSLRAAAAADILIIVGTSGGTNLPMQIGRLATQRHIPIVVINQDPNPFSDRLRGGDGGWFLQGKAGELVPQLAEVLS